MSRRRRRKQSPQPGALPGTLRSDPQAPPPLIRAVAYGPDGFIERAVEVAEIPALLTRWAVTWIDVNGLGNADAIRRIGEIFALHPLAMEDATHTRQRPKVEAYEEHLFIVARMAIMNAHLETEQVSLFLGRNFVVTFQEDIPGDAFNPVRDRIRKNAGRIRASGADYLAYSLLDAVIDGYFPVLEDMGERLEILEDKILTSPTRRVMAELYNAKRELLTLRRAVWPLREATNTLVRDVLPLIKDETRLHLRDCYDHTVRMIDLIETYRELASDLVDVYLSSVSQKMTEVMKVLTIIATIFIPLTFISSIYGMNFQTGASPWNMPELAWYWGYPFALGLMAVTAAALVAYFWWKGWLGTSDGDIDTHGDTPEPHA